MTQPTGKPDHRGGDARKLRELEAQLDGLQKAYQRACCTIADMHAAAVGEVRQPVRGVVEDIIDTRRSWGDEIDHLAGLVATSSFERSQIARQMTEDQIFYGARIEQLVKALADAGIEDPAVPESERKTIVPAEFYDALVAEEG